MRFKNKQNNKRHPKAVQGQQGHRTPRRFARLEGEG
jgi:hypothetical protein